MKTDKDAIKEIENYGMPNVGCLVGTAYQALVNRLSAALEEAGLGVTVPEYLVLRVLYNEEGLQQCELAACLSRDKAAICRTVKGMAAKGLVTTETVSHKCLKVYLSEKGRELKPAIMAVADARQQALAELLPGDRMSSFVEMLKKIIQGV